MTSGLHELVLAHVDGDRAREAALSSAFGVWLEKPPPAPLGLELVLRATLEVLPRKGSPFDGMLEAPDTIIALYGRYAERIGGPHAERRAALLDMAVDLIVLIWRVPADVTAEV